MFQNFVHPTAVKGRKDYQLCESLPSSDSSHLLPSWGAPQQCCRSLSSSRYIVVFVHPVHVKANKIGPKVLKNIPFTTFYSATSHWHHWPAIKYTHEYGIGDNLELCGTPSHHLHPTTHIETSPMSGENNSSVKLLGWRLGLSIAA